MTVWAIFFCMMGNCNRLETAPYYASQHDCETQIVAMGFANLERDTHGQMYYECRHRQVEVWQR